jgi:hypothetical protein
MTYINLYIINVCCLNDYTTQLEEKYRSRAKYDENIQWEMKKLDKITRAS